MNQQVNTISNRLSLRKPQRDSLEILARVCEIIDLDKSADIVQQLETIKSEFPTVEDFERDFPSLCFALATGVGKTRLMGAFIVYLLRVNPRLTYLIILFFGQVELRSGHGDTLLTVITVSGALLRVRRKAVSDEFVCHTPVRDEPHRDGTVFQHR